MSTSALHSALLGMNTALQGAPASDHSPEVLTACTLRAQIAHELSSRLGLTAEERATATAHAAPSELDALRRQAGKLMDVNDSDAATAESRADERAVLDEISGIQRGERA